MSFDISAIHLKSGNRFCDLMRPKLIFYDKHHIENNPNAVQKPTLVLLGTSLVVRAMLTLKTEMSKQNSILYNTYAILTLLW